MKISQIIERFQEDLDNFGDAEVIVIWWEKRNFDYADDDELILTDEAWRKVSDEFDSWDNAGTDITEWISDAVSEHAEIREFPS